MDSQEKLQTTLDSFKSAYEADLKRQSEQDKASAELVKSDSEKNQDFQKAIQDSLSKIEQNTAQTSAPAMSTDLSTQMNQLIALEKEQVKIQNSQYAAQTLTLSIVLAALIITIVWTICKVTANAFRNILLD